MKNKRNKLLYVLIVLVFLGVFLGWYIFLGSKDSEIVISDGKESDLNELPTIDEKIVVHITGAVVNPGVVSLSSGTRMIEAIDQIGGLRENADTEAINLARRLKDEEKIDIPEIGEVDKQTSKQADGRVNINTASLEELKTLPGVGDVIAQGIIDYRKKNGNFTQLEDLKNVSRIGEKVYQGLSDLIIL